MPTSTGLDHVTIVTDDFEASRAVYDAVLGASGLTALVEYSDPEAEPDDPGTVAAVGYGAPGGPALLWLVAGTVATRGAHLALAVSRREQVLDAHRAALAVGATVRQPPRDWEADRLGYFGAQFTDPGGNVVEVRFS
jgi:catechol 2,3-dioxygenase-like lactoylglutathione lyase family enzyme